METWPPPGTSSCNDLLTALETNSFPRLGVNFRQVTLLAPLHFKERSACQLFRSVTNSSKFARYSREISNYINLYLKREEAACWVNQPGKSLMLAQPEPMENLQPTCTHEFDKAC